MNLRSILCPVDGSDASMEALKTAVSLARESGATLHLLHVDESAIPSGAAGFAIQSSVPAHADPLDHLTEQVPGLAKVRLETHTARGFPSDEIIDFATRREMELIVMGTHGRRGLTRMVMGSTAEAVVRWSRCPVLTVKAPHESKRAAAAEEHSS